MFIYFHGYHPDAWDSMVKAGLIDENAGIRFCQSKMLTDDMKFNTLAAKGTKLHQLIEERKMPFYIDRLQGGGYIDDYVYDSELVEHYRQILGDQFYGFQMHEWASNLYSDVKKIKWNPDCDWTKDSIEKTIYAQFPFPFLFLEAMSSEEFAQMGSIDNADDYYKAAVELLERRQKEAGELMVCDSYAITTKLALDRGVKDFMPEVGAQTPNVCLQVSYARSMAKAYGVRFGVYYEPWGGDPFSACCYEREGRNEWGIGGSSDFPFETMGENGGSSRSLQKRIHWYSYLSGADYMAEEWGICNTFYDWTTGELSPYGQAKKEFLEFVKKYPVVGEKIAPIALVLPKELDIYNIEERQTFCTYELDDATREKLEKIREQVAKVFISPTDDMQGTEVRNLFNTHMPDAVALLHEDSAGLEKFAYLVDLTPSGAIKAKYNNVCEVDEIPALLRELLPCYVDGGLHWMVNKAEDGYYLAIFNHSGVMRTVADGEYILPGTEKTVTLRINGDLALQVLEGSATVEKIGCEYHITVPGGDWLFAKF